MAVSQRFIDLLNLPKRALLAIAEQEEVELPHGADRWQVAAQLSELPRNRLEDDGDGYLYAGRTSLIWYRLRPKTAADGDQAEGSSADPQDIEVPPLDPDAVREALSTLADHDVFSEAERPEQVTPTPQLVTARACGQGLMLTFVQKKRLMRVINNFGEQNVNEDEFFNVYLRPDEAILEVRSSATTAARLERTWLKRFVTILDLEAVRLPITYAHVLALHGELDARADRFEGRDKTGTSVFEAQRFDKAAA